MTRPFEGLRVLDFPQVLAGPYATCIDKSETLSAAGMSPLVVAIFLKRGRVMTAVDGYLDRFGANARLYATTVERAFSRTSPATVTTQPGAKADEQRFSRLAVASSHI